MYGLSAYNGSKEGIPLYAIAVHGISGDNTTWESLRLRKGYVDFCQSLGIGVALYTYPLVDKSATVFTMDGIRCEALRLLEAIQISNRTENSSLIFIGHDIGGLLIKEALLLAATGDPKFRDIYWSTTALFFIGCPHVESPTAGLPTSISRLIKLNNTFSAHIRSDIATSMAHLVPRINQGFAKADMGMFTFIYNVSSTHSNLDERFFDPSETQLNMDWVEGLQKESFMSHLDILRAMDDARIFRIMVSICKSYQVCLWAGEDALDLLEALVSEAEKTLDREVYIKQVTILLDAAVHDRKSELVTYLIQAGADLTQKTGRGDGPFHGAVRQCYNEIVVSLLEAGANTELESSNHWKPIHVAAKHQPDTFEIVLDHGIGINSITGFGATPLMIAVANENEKSMEALLARNPDLHCSSETSSLLSFALGKRNSRRVVDRLLDAGMDPYHKNVVEVNKYQLHRCVEDNQIEILQRLLSYNCPINQRDSWGQTPLNCITATSDISIIRHLVCRGANIDHPDNDYQTPLAKMVPNNDMQRAKFLLRLGANPNAFFSCSDNPPLHIACNKCSLDMIKMLIDHGADVNYSHDGPLGTIFQAACQRADVDTDAKLAILDYILTMQNFDPKRRNRYWGNNLATACLFTDIGVVERLVKLGVDIDGEDILGRRPIHFALYRTLELVGYLHNNGADIFAKDLMGRNALHFAVVSGSVRIVKYILDQKPDLVNEEDCDGWTPLHWAVREYHRWGIQSAHRRGIIKVLRRRGANIMMTGKGVGRFWTPYELARYYDLDDNIVKLLIPSGKLLKDSPDAGWWRRITDPLEDHEKAIMFEGSDYCDFCLMESVKNGALFQVPWLNMG